MRLSIKKVVDLVQTILQQIYIVTSRKFEKPSSSSGIISSKLIANGHQIIFLLTYSTISRMMYMTFYNIRISTIKEKYAETPNKSHQRVA